MRIVCAAAAVLAIFGINRSGAGQENQAPLGSPSFAPSAERPVGWRGDGNGRYPAADPPLAWGRMSSAVKELGAQARKPKDDDKGKPIPDGVIRQWLIAGPVPIPDGKTAKDDFNEDEPKLAPDAEDKLGNLQWKSVSTDTSYVDFWPMYDKAVPDGKGHVAYAFAWLHSAEGKPVYLDAMFPAAARAWINGKPAGNYPRNDGLQYGIRVQLPLQKGWNRLLLRVSPLLDTAWSKGVIQWHFNAALFGTEKSEFESSGILWTTPMPDNGPGVSSPILVGDKLLMEAEAGVLVCVSAKDGKVLWARSSTYADAATPEERNKNPEVFAEIDALAAKVKDALKAYCDAPAKYVADAKGRNERIAWERKINDLMVKLNGQKYAGQSGSEAGESAPTPASDGRNVYALYGNGVAACFDLEGNRKWTTAVSVKHNEHGYCSSPCLVDGKVIVKASSYTGAVALDAKTGAVAMPIPLWKAKGLAAYSTPLAIPVGGEKVVVQSFGVITRAGDGKVLARKFAPPYYNTADYVSPTVEGKTVCSYVLARNPGGARFAFQTLPDAAADPLAMRDTKECEYSLKAFPCWFSYDHNSSPLLYQGLAYVLSVDGVLTVIDAAKGEVVYQKLLDLAPWMVHNGIIRCGCGASPTLAGKHIYIWDNQGTALVIEPGRQFKQVARNRIEQIWFRYGPERNECTVSNPVFWGKRMFYRTEANLYCIGGAD
ncbi:MAG: PQQ-binding-like beta-propeller repeat protein [Phycisphaerae bacterium]